MYTYNKFGLSPYDPTKITTCSFLLPEDDLLSNCGPNVKKTVSFDDVVHFIDEEDLVTYVDFDCGIFFLSEIPTKIRQINRERNYISRSGENPSAFPAAINMSVLLMSSIVLISFWPRTFYGTCFQQLLRHSTTIMIDTLYPISTLNQQLTNLEQTHIRCPLHCERWTVKGKDYALAMRSSKEITYRTDEWTKQLLRLKSWVISESPEQWMDFRRLRWTLTAYKCSYLFQLFDFHCCWCNICCFWKITFLFLFFDDFEWKVKVHWQPLC